MTQSRWTPTEPRAPLAIVDVVLGVPSPERRRRLLIAALATLGAHASLWVWAQRAERSTDSPAQSTANVDAELSYDIEPAQPPPSPAAEPKTQDPEKSATLPKLRTTSRSHTAVKPPPAAQAGAVIAQEPSSGAPADLTGETFIIGTANAYAGGVTASTGANTAAVRTREVDASSPSVTHAAGPDHSSKLALEEQTWSCPWPREAEAEQIDEQTVVIRVIVGAAGHAESVTIVSDPGHGFGQAAATCALRTRFTPARDRDGKPARTQSPPIRVRFTR